MDDSEKLLIEKSAGGDVEAFETLIQSYQKKVYNIALRMTKNPEDALELSQDAFLRVFIAIKKFRGDSSFATWLYRITMNVCTDFLRKRSKTTVISIEQPGHENDQAMQLADNGPGPSGVFEKNQLKELVKDAMDLLPPEHRQVLILRDLLDLPYKEIAHTLNVNEGTIKSRINRARESLKKIIINRSELFQDYVVKLYRKGGDS